MTRVFVYPAVSSRTITNLYTRSESAFEARRPVEYTGIHELGTEKSTDATKIPTEVVFPQRRGVLMSVY